MSVFYDNKIINLNQSGPPPRLEGCVGTVSTTSAPQNDGPGQWLGLL